MKSIVPYLRFLAGLRAYGRDTLGFEQARRTLARRMGEREASFARVLKQCVYDRPGSPYLALLRRAGCDYSDALEGLRTHGVERLLARFRQDGVWLSFDEFKGRRPIVRDGLEHVCSDADFDNPCVSAGCAMSTAGSSGQATRSYHDLDHLAERAVYDALFFRMLGLDGVPLALWYPGLPATTGVGNALRYAKIGHAVDRWFAAALDGSPTSGLLQRLATRALVLGAQTSGLRIPWPVPTPLTDVERVMAWVMDRKARHGRCVMQSYVSQAVRICRAAAEQPVDLSGVQFIVGSEPLTETGRQAIEATGATAHLRYHSTELGTIGTVCGAPEETGDVHLVFDTVTAVQDAAEALEGRGAPLYLTALRPTTPKVMINVAMGDVGILGRRSCGCLLGELGLDVYVRQVHSVERTTVEGMSVPMADLVRAAEDALRHLGPQAALCCQWIERKDASGLTRLYLRIDPRLGAVDEGRVVQGVLEGLAGAGRPGRMHAESWRQAGTIRILREPPRPTPGGKLLPFVREEHARG
jgi:hypothetical protein